MRWAGLPSISTLPEVGLIDGEPAHRMAPYFLAQKVAYVPQRSTVAAAFTVREIVELGRYVLPVNHQRVDDALARLQLTDLAHRPYAELSDGQQQRVTLARALAQLNFRQSSDKREDAAEVESPHLVLDEPMSAMDLRHVRDVVSLLRELSSQGVTILIALHDLTLAAAIADDVWLLEDGTMTAGAADEVLTVQRLREVYGVPFEWVRGRLLTALHQPEAGGNA